MSSKQGFIKGTLILISANAISKILGATFKIPLTHFLREEGMAIYNTSFNVYIMILSFIISGMPLAISKSVAEELALGRQANAKKIVTVSSLFLGGLGIFASLLLWFGADFFSIAMKEPKALFCLKIISPSIFFVAIGTVYKSFYQGRMNMTPTAISQVIEAFVKLAAGYGLALYYSHLAVEYTAAAAIMGVTIGEIVATLILFILYLPHRFKRETTPPDIKASRIINSLLVIAVPAIIASALSSLLDLIDLTIIRRTLEEIVFTRTSAESFLRIYSSYTDVFDTLLETLKITSDGSRWLYGAYSGYALTVFHLPVGILGTLGVSILPAIAGALAAKNHKKAEVCTAVAVKFTMLFSIPAAFFIGFFSEPVLDILFNNTASSHMLSCLAPCLVFMSLFNILTAVSNASDRIIPPFIIAFAGGVLKIILNYILIRNPHINMMGTVISADISYLFAASALYFYIKKQFMIKSFFKGFIIKPLFSSIFMTAVIYMLYQPFLIIFTSEILSLFLSTTVGIISYILMLICTHSLSPDDIKMIKGH